MSDYRNRVDVKNTAGNLKPAGESKSTGTSAPTCSQTATIAATALAEGSNLDQAVDAMAAVLKDFGYNAKVRDLRIQHPGLEKDIPVTVSIGLTEVRPSDNVSTWLDRADQALYRAKQSGRNRLDIN